MNFRFEKKFFRIPEIVLICVALIGGSVGSILGMLCLRHKIRKSRFYSGLPLMLIVHIFIVFLLYLSFTG